MSHKHLIIKYCSFEGLAFLKILLCNDNVTKNYINPYGSGFELLQYMTGARFEHATSRFLSIIAEGSSLIVLLHMSLAL